eukprot:Clim_evm14s199 gene=Clim_evmTU14s199
MPSLTSDEQLARMLQMEEEGGGDYYGGWVDQEESDGSDGEWGRPKKKAKSVSRKRAPKPPPSPREISDKGRRIRRDQGKATARSVQHWNSEETDKFYKGMMVWGRNWQAISEYLGTCRDPRNIASKAQKWFVKQYVERKPLPEVMGKTTGFGYTLSGKPLDPQSTALSKFGGSKYLKEKDKFSPPPQDGTKLPEWESITTVLPAEEVEEMKRQRTANCEAGKVFDKEASEKAKAAEAAARENQDPNGQPGPVKTVKAIPTKSRRQRWEEHQKIVGRFVTKNEEKPPTREKKERRAKTQATGFMNLDSQGHSHNALMMVQCTQYAEDTQPFAVTVAPWVDFVMDCHAHLAMSEIIGFLAGTWDAETATLTVQEALPCRSLALGTTETSVEVDPADEVRVRDLIAEKGYRCVGWYHSHPTFKPIPSLRDVENQHNYQMLFNRDNTFDSPFVGAIVSPYDRDLPTMHSKTSWFYVAPGQRDSAMVLNMKNSLDATIDPDEVYDKINSLCDICVGALERIHSLAEVWRMEGPNMDLDGREDGDQVPRTISEKMNFSLRLALTRHGVKIDDAEQAVTMALEIIAGNWELDME